MPGRPTDPGAGAYGHPLLDALMGQGLSYTPPAPRYVSNAPLLMSELQRLTGVGMDEPDLLSGWPMSMESYLDMWQTAVPDTKAYQASRDRSVQALDILARQAASGRTVAGMRGRQMASAATKAAPRAAAGSAGDRSRALQAIQAQMLGIQGQALPGAAKEQAGLYSALAQGTGALRGTDQTAWQQALQRAVADAKLRAELTGLGLKDLGQVYDAALTRMGINTGGGWGERWGPAIGGTISGLGQAIAATGGTGSDSGGGGGGGGYYQDQGGKGWYDEPGAGKYY